MEIILNGEVKKVRAVNIYDLVKSLELDSDGVVILHNDEIVKKELWPARNLKVKDSVEVLYFVSGG
ncbi:MULTISPECIES: sulfur carrier protein ThiS [Psychrilyobacter]|uniref:Sulfur carrier protein ThiS n=1 Tax=Psychrilyobacter piezotolerans TaxID=2293438 RepID=A0ABX9KDC5_9FUSO|nr:MULTISPECIES: sulfur carrier protein ThiS [Psychrilyobacter]MCS5422368.1 sulfur carrier protein ThiS [Psychrilyobacter sp. S5]NDI79101.1 sulfur carrier protein ThiS [Psychrilyobacter piezotolerans]RDE58976.1 sulfur carrier protein ThiS [Psychrilyobacter sp. S5]REI39543.1 sulfur carrier protein ThiS [Psychrilyobacter piezotolerans]